MADGSLTQTIRKRLHTANLRYHRAARRPVMITFQYQAVCAGVHSMYIEPEHVMDCYVQR